MNKRRAFTLFEVLVALAVVVVLVGVMSSTLNVAFRQKRSAEEAIEAVRDIQIVGDIWVQELQCTLPPNLNSNVDPLAAQFNQAAASASGDLTGAASSVPTYLFGPFLGDIQTIAFYASGSEPKAEIQSGSRYVTFGLETQLDGQIALVRRIETNLLSDSDPATFPSALEPDVLITNVDSVAFQYFDGTNWSTSWDSTQQGNTLPYAVSIELVLRPQREGAPARVIKRFATIWCAEGANAAAAATAATAADAAAAAGGF